MGIVGAVTLAVARLSADQAMSGICMKLWFKSRVASIGFGVPSISMALCWMKSSG